MGEYANFNGHQIKIGTCEDMYYLRADQRMRVGPLGGNVHPVKDAQAIRFRFPWPDEDRIEPGAFDPYDRGTTLPGLTAPEGVEHYAVQLSGQRYLTSIPCPEGAEGKAWETSSGRTIRRNGFWGRVQLVQQRLGKDGQTWMAILRCGGCGGAWRCETWEDAAPAVLACLEEAGHARNRMEASTERWWHTVAERIAAGYGRAVDGRVAA